VAATPLNRCSTMLAIFFHKIKTTFRTSSCLPNHAISKTARVINFPHQLNLAIFFAIVTLIYTDSVDPEVWGFIISLPSKGSSKAVGTFSQLPKSFFQVMGNG
jgi:hypothetical protein